MKTRKAGKSKKIDSATKKTKRSSGKKKISTSKRILKDGHRPNHPHFDKLRKLTIEEILRAQADYISQYPPAVFTSIPEKAYHDPVTAKLVRDNIIAIMAPNFNLGKGQRKFNSCIAKKKANDEAPEKERRNKIIIEKAVAMRARRPLLSLRVIANSLLDDPEIKIGFESIRKIIRPALKK